jgi:cytoskeletal protein RodZ
MKPRDLRELLGGYAAGTLTPEEREALFQAALDNQALFDALVGEEALRELLADPACRAQLLRDLDQQPAAFWQRFAQWMRRPATLAFAGSAAALVLVIGVVRFTQREPEAPKLVAQAPRHVELPPTASPVRQPEPKLMRPMAPPAETQVGQVRPEPAVQATAVAPQPAAPKLVAQGPQQVELPPTASPVRQPEPKLMRPAAPPEQAQVRQVRREPAALATAAAPQSAALSCTVLARSSQGDWIEAAPDATFRQGAEVRLRVRSAEDGSILVTAQDGATVTMLTPPTGAPASSGQDLILPPAGSFELAGASGEKNLRISFLPRSSAAPVTAFQFAKSAAAPAAGARAGVAGSARAPAARRKGEAADSAQAPAAKPPLVIELRLVYRSK